MSPGAYDSTFNVFGNSSRDGFVARLPATLAQPGILVDVRGPNAIAPGQRGTYTVNYANGLDLIARNVVITASVPAGVNLVDIGGGGMFYPGGSGCGGEVMWRIASMNPLDAGAFTFTVELPWGAADGEFEVTARGAAANEATPYFDVAPYVAFVPTPHPTSVDLDASGVAAQLAAFPAAKSLLDYARSIGYRFFDTGSLDTMADGTKVLRLYVFAPDGGLATLAATGDQAFIDRFIADTYMLMDADGGFIWDRSRRHVDAVRRMGDHHAAVRQPDAGARRRVRSDPVGDGRKRLRRVALPLQLHDQQDSGCRPQQAVGDRQGRQRRPELRGVRAIDQERRRERRGMPEVLCGDGQERRGGQVPRAGHRRGHQGVLHHRELRRGLQGTRPSTSARQTSGSAARRCLSWLGGFDAKCGRRATRRPEPIPRRSPAACSCPYAAPICTDGVCGPKPKCTGVSCKKKQTRTRVARDPNAKAVTPGGIVLATDTLTYTLDYENVGAGPAEAVFILDTLDTHLDPTTLTLDPRCAYVAPNRLITCTIGTLAAAGEAGAKGSVTFTVKPMPGLAMGTEIVNQAEVHFPSAFEITPTNAVVNRIGGLRADPLSLATSGGHARRRRAAWRRRVGQGDHLPHHAPPPQRHADGHGREPRLHAGRELRRAATTSSTSPQRHR